MTFYSMIFGILFVAATGELLRSLNHPAFRHAVEALVVMLLIISDVIYTSHVIEDRKIGYKVSLKFLDLLSFFLLTAAIFTLNPAKEGRFGAAGAEPYLTAFFWCLIVLYWGTLILWNAVAGVYKRLPPDKRWQQPAIAAPLVVTAVAAVVAPGSGFVSLCRVAVLIIIIWYVAFYKRSVLNQMSDQRPRRETPRVNLEPLTDADALVIHQWPEYPPQYMALDYALRQGGWLAEFPNGPKNHRYAARCNGDLVAFSILAETSKPEAEFYVAVDPRKLGSGVGSVVTKLTLEAGFDHLGLHRIWLKVRAWHSVGIHIYERAGFRHTGKPFEDTAGGRPDQFVVMEAFPQN
jgi:RimJ/RimL family protein N-acetyltransferase